MRPRTARLDLLVVARRLRPVHRVAVDAGDVDLAVLGDRPVLEMPLSTMAGEAHRRLLGRGRRLRTKDVRRFALRRILQMRRRIAVARLACAAVRVVGRAVTREQDRAVLLLVALDADGHRRSGRLLLRERGRRQERREQRECSRGGDEGLDSHVYPLGSTRTRASARSPRAARPRAAGHRCAERTSARICFQRAGSSPAACQTLLFSGSRSHAQIHCVFARPQKTLLRRSGILSAGRTCGSIRDVSARWRCCKNTSLIRLKKRFLPATTVDLRQ